MATLRFPELSRQSALKTKQTTADPTIRDEYENGLVSTRARSTRVRRTFDITLELLTPDDKRKLERFVAMKSLFGALPFVYADTTDPKNPEQYTVRFTELPAFDDAGWAGDSLKYTCKFKVAEV